MKKLAILGASGHGKVVANIALLNGYDEIVFLDDKDGLSALGNYAVVGKTKYAKELAVDGYDFIVGIGNARIRKKLQEQLIEDKCNVISLVHPKARIAYDVNIGIGTVIMANSVVSAGTNIGKGCIINTSANVGCECYIGAYAHVSVGSIVGDSVHIGNGAWIGIGSKVKSNVSIVPGTMIGAGACVLENIEVAGTYVGVPAREG